MEDGIIIVKRYDLVDTIVHEGGTPKIIIEMYKEEKGVSIIENGPHRALIIDGRPYLLGDAK